MRIESFTVKCSKCDYPVTILANKKPWTTCVSCGAKYKLQGLRLRGNESGTLTEIGGIVVANGELRR